MTENGFPSSLREEKTMEKILGVRMMRERPCMRVSKNDQKPKNDRSGFSAHVKMESLLVEWACGKGVTVLPPTNFQQ